MSRQTYSPLIFEIHHDRADDKGRSGLIGSGLVSDNPVYQSLQRDFGEYSPNYSASSHGGYGGPRSGMALIELGRSYKNWTPEIIEQNTGKLWDSLMSNEGVKSGKRQLHFFVGHGDVITGQTGAPGEREMNRAVITALQKRAKEAGLTNFNFYKSIPTESGSHKDSNWSRARNIFDGGDGGLRWEGSAIVPTEPNTDGNSITPSTPGPDDGPTPQRVEAVTRAKEYSKMSKAEMNSAYDDLRKSDPAKAAIEGKKMHRAFFGK